MKLTTKQAATLAFIKDHLHQIGYAPTNLEITTHFGWSSVTAAKNHVRALERKGIIRTTPRVARSIVVL